MTEGRAPTWATFSERDLTDVDTPPPPPPQFLASVEAAARTAPGRTQLRAPSLDTALSVTDVDLGAVLLGDESSDDDDDDYAPAPYNQLQKQKKPPAPAPRFSRAVCQFEPLEAQKNAERYVVKLQLIPDLSPRVTAYLERDDDAEVVPTPASGLRLVVEATGDADERDAGPVSGWVVAHLARRRDVSDGALSWSTGAEGGCVGVSWKCVFVTRQNAETCVESTSELGYFVNLQAIEPTRSRPQRRVDGVESPRRRADAVTGTTAPRWRGASEI